MAIHRARDAFMISSQGVWRPGAYESDRAARYAARLADEVLDALQEAANIRSGGTGGVITYSDLQGAKTNRPHR